jgi:hypothetical protein
LGALVHGFAAAVVAEAHGNPLDLVPPKAAAMGLEAVRAEPADELQQLFPRHAWSVGHTVSLRLQ